MASFLPIFEEITNGVRVTVQSEYLENESEPHNRHYVFTYHITIANQGEVPVQLLNRHWVITNADGQTEEVNGPGVVGYQPRLAPGQSFQYSSFCPLSTPVGSMQGTYQMLQEDGSFFDAKIPIFTLAVPGSLN